MSRKGDGACWQAIGDVAEKVFEAAGLNVLRSTRPPNEELGFRRAPLIGPQLPAAEWTSAGCRSLSCWSNRSVGPRGCCTPRSRRETEDRSSPR